MTTPVDWLEPKELVGPTLRLVPLQVADAADFLAALGEPTLADQVTRHLSYYAPRNLEQARAVIRTIADVGDRVAYAQRLADTGQLVGVTAFYDIDPPTRSLAIGHTWIAHRFWRTGLNTESKLLMLGRAFDELGAERVVWHTDILNLRSQAAIERLGAAREGVLRHHRIRPDGSWRDTVQFSMLSAEWPAARERLGQPRLQSRRNAEGSRFEGWLGDELASVIDYQQSGSTLAFTHTGTVPHRRGRGLAAQLTRFALEDARAHGERVRPLCPFTARFLDGHPEYRDLLA